MILNIEKEDYDKKGIYKIRNIITDSYYIGETTEGFYKRFLRHNNLLVNNKHFNVHLQRAYNKYGTDAFEFSIISRSENANEIVLLEEQYIKEYKNNYDCYNYLSGGPSMAKENNPMYGKHLTEEHKLRMSVSLKGKCAGEKNYFFGKDHSGEKNGFYGKHHTEESKLKMSIAKKNFCQSLKEIHFLGKLTRQKPLKK